MLNYKIHMQPTRIWTESGAKTNLSWSTLPFKSLGTISFCLFVFLKEINYFKKCITISTKIY